jgi:hypothetical protein
MEKVNTSLSAEVRSWTLVKRPGILPGFFTSALSGYEPSSRPVFFA